MVSANVSLGIENLSAAKRLVGQFGGYSGERISTASGIRSSSRNSDKSAYIARMLFRVRNSRGRPLNAYCLLLPICNLELPCQKRIEIRPVV
jgi:hypothetical protein